MKKNDRIHFENETPKNLFSNSLSRILFGCLFILLVVCLSACGRTASKSSLLSYAEENYGKYELIREEHSGKDKDEKRTLYLQDIDTGLEYSITSKMESQGLDGSEFIWFEKKRSDFVEKYRNYVYDLSERELSKLNTRHPAQIMFSDTLSNKIIFDSRTSDDDSKIVCRKIGEIIASNDIKNFLSISFLVYCENEDICIGYYDYSSDTFESYGPYIVIDYVYENIDKDAEFLFSIPGCLASYLLYEDIEKMDLHDELATFYNFRSSTGVEFVAFDMKHFGKNGIYCVSKDSREKFILSTPLP